MMFMAVSLLLLAQSGPAHRKIVNQTSTFKTPHYTIAMPHYTIAITTHCQDGDVGCDKVTYKSLSSSGKTITLQGKEDMRMCPADPKTPCGSNGYVFHNGDVTYSVPQDMMDGDLLVTQKDKEILREAGHWTDSQ